MKKTGLLFLIFIVFRGTIFPQGINDIIRPVHLQAGKSDTLHISDLFYSNDYNLKIIPGDNIKAVYNRESKNLAVEPAAEFEGIGLINFTLNDSLYSIPFYSDIVKDQTFYLSLKDHPERVNLFASFNGWNRENLPMNYDKKKKSYTVTVPLEPGTYQYKFYVMGKEFIDPENPDSIPNGLGGYNSLITVPDPHPEQSYLFVNGYEKTQDRITVNFSYSNSKYRSPVRREEITALYNNSELPQKRVSTAANRFLVTIDSVKLKGENVLRVFVNRNGLPSNIQTLRFYNGEPDGKINHRTEYDNIIYSIMIDRFNDGDSSNSIPVINPNLTKKANYFGGDLQGIINKIDDGYFDSLGVNTLWLSPVVDNTDSAYREYPKPHRYYTGYHGYWPISSTRVEERFGDMNLLKDLVKDAHRHNIHILIDYVANHVQ